MEKIEKFTLGSVLKEFESDNSTTGFIELSGNKYELSYKNMDVICGAIKNKTYGDVNNELLYDLREYLDLFSKYLWKSDESYLHVKDFLEKESCKIGEHNIPQDNFHMMYIERDNNHIRENSRDDLYTRDQYHKNLFDNEKGYSKAMTKAFDFLNQKLEEKTKLSVELIKQFHEIATNGVELDDKGAEPGGYRSDRGTSFGFHANQISKKFFDEISLNRDFIINDKKAALYAFPQNPEFVKFLSTEEMIRVSLENEASELLETLVNKVNNSLDQKELNDDKKIEIIGNLIHDCDTLHPFRDGNGRVFDFLVLNYLLIQQNLSPCSVYNTWHICGFTSEQRIEAIKEGQEFFKNFISSNVEERIPSNPLTEQLKVIVDEMLELAMQEDSVNKCMDEIKQIIISKCDDNSAVTEIKNILKEGIIDESKISRHVFVGKEEKHLLYLAAEQQGDKVGIASLLLDSGCDPNILDTRYSSTPLNEAVRNKNASIVNLLLDRGVDPSKGEYDPHNNKWETSPIDYLENKDGYDEIINILEKATKEYKEKPLTVVKDPECSEMVKKDKLNFK